MHDAPVAPADEDDVITQMRFRAATRVDEAREFLQQNPLVGLNADEAGQLARAAGIPFRSVEVSQPILSADMRPGRITAMVEGAVVVRAEVGN